jgi:Subtilase family
VFATNIIRRRKAAAVADRRARVCQVLLSTCIGVLLGSLTFRVSAATDQPGAAQSPELRLLAGVQAVCGGAAVHADGEDIVIPGGTLIEKSPLVVRGREVGQRRRFAMADSGDRVLLETIEPGGLLRRVRAELHTSAENVNRGLRPALVIVADGQCRVQTARRLIYDADGNAEYLEQLTPALDAVQVREPLNPPVPVVTQGGEPEIPGVGVAMLDAGVNYLLPSIAERLARNADGEILGFDYWDMDHRPFDANPVRSPFFPQRHGTQTASLLLDEAPVARLVPYRYPRPDMMRMTDLIQQAADDGVVILNISLGSNRKQEWSAFENAAVAHPDMLFVVSAGNNGRDIDSQPVYPASLDLENMLVVSSADPGGRPAQGSNWGRASVDLLVPAEEILTTDFHGRPRVVSGSSYAAARVSALAACLLQQNPEWRADMLKAAILEQSREPVGGQQAYSAYGFLPDPAARQRGACAAMPREVVESARLIWTYADLAGGAVGIQSSFTHELRLTLVIMEGAGWQVEAIREAAVKAAEILAQCGVAIAEVTVRIVEGPESMKIFRTDWSKQLVSELAAEKPAVFFVKDTLQDIAFDAEAFGRSNSRKRRQLADTVWIMSGAADLDVTLAHELYHSLADTGQHDTDPLNLMFERTSGTNTTLRASQCLRLIRVGEALRNLTPVR